MERCTECIDHNEERSCVCDLHEGETTGSSESKPGGNKANPNKEKRGVPSIKKKIAQERKKSFEEPLIKIQRHKVPLRRRCCRFSPQKDDDGITSLQYDFATIKVATDNFSNTNKLGQGGFGPVYKGILPNGDEFAVKRLSKGSGQGEVEFKNDVLLMAKLQHMNLVKLLGFCLEGEERLLVYEFVTNRSLDHFIFDTIKGAELDWDKRYKIIGGIAKGLVYLHDDSSRRIMHRDIKASNILLDADMNAKIADCGISRCFALDETQGSTSKITGTFGYMALKELRGHNSVKSDVYSFGVLVLEIISGQKINKTFRDEDKTESLMSYLSNCLYKTFRDEDKTESLLSYAWKMWQEETALNLIEPTMRYKSGSIDNIIRCIHIGLLCVQENVGYRPNMASVVLMLSTSISLTLPAPTKPASLLNGSSALEMEMPLVEQRMGRDTPGSKHGMEAGVTPSELNGGQSKKHAQERDDEVSTLRKE